MARLTSRGTWGVKIVFMRHGRQSDYGTPKYKAVQGEGSLTRTEALQKARDANSGGWRRNASKASTSTSYVVDGLGPRRFTRVAAERAARTLSIQHPDAPRFVEISRVGRDGGLVHVKTIVPKVKRNPPKGYIPCRAVKITRNKGRLEVRIKK